ncbi:hypothetical protein SAMD00019534_120820 [Acytostelium subglobosum LB1]|uniref:hypothetical protein n=1 Tax=Acytostelium subglobosum LB1 TaxID=1410327 RepID=UPI0006451991|nr:hypothetical protein SAMD00019534_120820 [Acytostelium subglobosum LB1]GAM28906.1 hypothetical protein SAMD00019534_120820 [Acytostelium subglobosum LB1]|eukprot:XP_012748091.1 hypothetical protein SAMD00019534_120820 [Acytostelium subglobosum LB1]
MANTGGDLYLFGKNSHGQLGLELFNSDQVVYDQDNFTPKPTLLTAYPNVTHFSAGILHTGFIMNGSLYMFGSNSFGKLGLGHTEDIKKPKSVYLINVKQVTCANEHTMALTEEGFVYSWGLGTLGRLGGSGTTRSVPARVAMPGTITRIFAGGASSAAIAVDGLLYTWGYNKYGQLGLGMVNEFREAPTLVKFFNNEVKIVDISLGDRHMAGIDSEGLLYTWGSNAELQLGDGYDDKSTPTQVLRRSDIRFIKVNCGGTFTCAISNADDDNNLYLWGTFADYASNTPKKFLSKVEDVTCSHDCSKNIIAVRSTGEVYTFGWSRYGQAGSTEEVAPLARMTSIVARPNVISCGGYHSGLLFISLPDRIFQMVHDGYWPSKPLTVDVLEHRNCDGDSLMHIIAKKRFDQPPLIQQCSALINKTNKEGRPPFFYYGKLLNYCKDKLPSIFFKDPDGQTCLHYYCRNEMFDDVNDILSFAAFDERVRDNDGKRAFDYIDKSVSFKIKKRHNISDIGILYTKEDSNLAAKIKKSIEENGYTADYLNATSGSITKRYIGYVFLVSRHSLSNTLATDLLKNVLVKAPMISIWAEKLQITDPTLESCIYRSQLVDFSNEQLYDSSVSVLIEGVHNIMDFVPKEKEVEDTDLKVDAEFVKVSGEESVFLSYDRTKKAKYKELFTYLQDSKIKIVPEEKGLLSSWVFIVILDSNELSAQVRDEISLAENRNKPVLSIYYNQDCKLNKASQYTFANAPKLIFDEEGFQQLLGLIKLQYAYLNISDKLFNLSNQ